MNIKEIVEHVLLQSDDTIYQISKHTGIAHQVLSRYRNGQQSISNMTLDTAFKIHDYYYYNNKNLPVD